MTRQIDILVAGAINTDLVATMERAPAAGETISGQSFGMHGGGKGANQAVAVARSEGRVAMIGAVGGDDFGQARLRDLTADGVDVGDVQVLAAQSSGVALILVETGGENRIAYVPGATLEVTEEAAVASLRRSVPKYVLATNELPPVALAALLARAADIGSTVVFNATPEPETSNALIPHVSILIVNEGEARALAPGVEGDLNEVVQALFAQHGCSVVVTLGERGVVAVHGGERFAVPSPSVRAVDTTGAGDTFCGAFVAELAAGSNFGTALRYAAAAGALSVTQAGAQSSIPTREDVAGFLAEQTG